jgi:hypothetical protein
LHRRKFFHNQFLNVFNFYNVLKKCWPKDH